MSKSTVRWFPAISRALSSMKQHRARPLGRLPGTTMAFAAALAAGCASSALAKGHSEQVLYSFTGGSDGGYPTAGLVKDSAGNLYGVASAGGINQACAGGTGCGVVFEVSASGAYSVLYAFTGGSDGADPQANLIVDQADNLYGTTEFGGPSNAGVVFKVSPNGTEKVLYAFTGESDGGTPLAGLIRDKAGNLYGTTAEGGGDPNGNCPAGCGTVFKLTPHGTESVLYAFTGENDGNSPQASVIMDTSGNLCGTTINGGANSEGAAFKLAPDGTETVLHSFGPGNDGQLPLAGVIMDGAGNLYGTTFAGGTTGFGIVYEVAPHGTETVLHSFSRNGTDGYFPYDSLIEDGAGNLYGTTDSCGADRAGVVFKLAPDGKESLLYTFTGGNDGAHSSGNLIRDQMIPGKTGGYLYGTTAEGGTDAVGVVFELKK